MSPCTYFHQIGWRVQDCDYRGAEGRKKRRTPKKIRNAHPSSESNGSSAIVEGHDGAISLQLVLCSAHPFGSSSQYLNHHKFVHPSRRSAGAVRPPSSELDLCCLRDWIALDAQEVTMLALNLRGIDARTEKTHRSAPFSMRSGPPHRACKCITFHEILAQSHRKNAG
jgi:hypothetical protein